MVIMNTKLIAGVIILSIIIVGGAIFVIGNHAANTQGSTYVNQTKANPVNTTSANTTGMLFANTQYAQFAYLVSSGSLSSQAQAALAGFNLTRTQNQNGTTTITITLLANGAKQTVNLKQGDKLYIIETSFGDDSFGGDSNLGDDGFVLVKANGYVA